MQDVTRQPDAEGDDVGAVVGQPGPTDDATRSDLPFTIPERLGADPALFADGGVPHMGALWTTGPEPLAAPAAPAEPDQPAEPDRRAEPERPAEPERSGEVERSAEVVVTPGDGAPADLTAHLPAAAPEGASLDLPNEAVPAPNEAVPAVAPEAGTEALGTIPRMSLQRRWARAQLSNWRLYLVRVLVSGVAVVAAVAVVPGVWFTSWQWGQFTQIAIIFGLLNALVKPLLQFLSLRFIFNTYGIVVIVINTLLLVLLAALMDDVLAARSAFSALVAGAAVGVFGLLLETLLGANPPVLDRDYKERNGLR